MSEAFLDHLQQHEWKGNIRELKNVIERAVILAEGPQLTVDENLPTEMQTASFRPNSPLSALSIWPASRNSISSGYSSIPGEIRPKPPASSISALRPCTARSMNTG